MPPRPSCCAVIPARGGSKGIPGKNIRPVGGIPLVAHSIEAAKKAPSVDRVFVSTDDAAIARVARQYGAEVIDRPAELATDTASSESALLHALEHLAATEAYRPELLVFLQCTSPLTASEDIEGTVRALIDEKADSALAVTPFHYFVWKREASGEAVGVNHDKRVRPRRQDREPQYLETGAVYVMRTEGFLAAKHRFFGRTALFEMPAERVAEIDEPEDLLRVEAQLAARGSKDLLAKLPPRIGALVMDFDGVLTDDKVTVREDGIESVVCSRSDGFGIEQLVKRGLPVAVISKEKNPVVEARCRKLRLECHQGIENKEPLFRAWLEKKGIAAEDAIYVGNDVTDVKCLELAGVGVVPADAHPRALAVANIVLSRRGGQGAIRELADRILEKLEEQT